MSQTATQLEPRIEQGKALQLAGYSETYTYDRRAELPAQWQRFGPLIGNIPGQVGRVAYGVCTGNDDNRSFAYLTGVEVGDAAKLDANLQVVHLPARRYAVFTHTGNVSTLRGTLDRIWQQWSRQNGQRIEKAPFFERYGESFDAKTGDGDVEIWIPLKA